MVNRTMMLRAFIVAIFFAMLTVVSTQKAAAQWPCKCGYITVSTASDFKCKFDLCVESALGTECQTIGPGIQTTYKCAKDTYIWVKDCHGNQVHIKADCNLGQSQVIALSNDCCIEVCAGLDSQGCLFVKIWGHPAPCDKCP